MTPEIEVVRHARARRARLSVDPRTGQVRLTLPPRAPVKAALRWAAEQQAWIEAQHARISPRRPFEPGAAIPLGDAEVTIGWDESWPRRIVHMDGALRCGGPIEAVPRRVELWLRREALALLRAETEACAAQAGVTVTAVTIGDPRGRWGSCSAAGAIRYSWRLILAPGFVRRSTVAHEVAHRVHMNHGPDFHALAAALDPGDPRRSRAWLREHGAELHRFG